MKKRFLYILIFIFPFLGMVITNELSRLSTAEKGYAKQGVIAINSANKMTSKCSWACHNDTGYCKENHVKFAQPYFTQIDPVYFGIIHSLRGTGDYDLANIIFLVILFPLIMLFLLTKSISMQLKINQSINQSINQLKKDSQG